MGLFKDLLGGGIVKKGVEMADEAIYTDQEKGKLKLILLRLYEPYKLAQRLLALLYSIPFVSLHVLYSLTDYYMRVNGMEAVCGELIQSNIDSLGEPAGWIIIWYFSGGMVEGGVKAFKGIRSKK